MKNHNAKGKALEKAKMGKKHVTAPSGRKFEIHESKSEGHKHNLPTKLSKSLKKRMELNYPKGFPHR